MSSPKSMLATTGVPERVLGLRGFLRTGRPDEDPSVRPLFGTLEDYEGLDEEHILHIHQQIRKKPQEGR